MTSISQDPEPFQEFSAASTSPDSQQKMSSYTSHIVSASGTGANAYNSKRPLDTSAGGVAISRQPGLPMGKAGIKDRIIGKTEKLIGKALDKPELHERGQLREMGGKEAAHGRARAVHN